jgi:hypothetical protein
VNPETVADLLDKYARDRDRAREVPPERGRLLFLGSRPITSRAALFWRYRLADHRLRLPPQARTTGVVMLLEAASREGVEAAAFQKELAGLFGTGMNAAWKVLRKGGLVCLKPLGDPRPLGP